MAVDIQRMNIQKVVKRVETARKVAQRKAKTEADEYNRRHEEWVNGANGYMSDLFDWIRKDFNFTNKYTFAMFTDEMEHILSTLEVDENCKNYLRGRLVLNHYFNAFPNNTLEPEVIEKYSDLSFHAMENVRKYDIPGLSKFCDECYGYKFWKDHYAEERQWNRLREGKTK